MEFTVSTKPLADALSLGVVNGNVSKFYRKSCLAQVSATKNTLKINLEASAIMTEIVLKGSGNSEASGIMFVDSLLLKQLVSTFDTSVVTLEFDENGLILHSGKSKFTLPKMVDEVDMELQAPTIPEYSAQAIAIDKSDWKFIKENQMYAIAMSFIHPVYTKVWIGSSGDVLVGDFDNSLFTHSQKSKLGATCLLSDTIINLFNSLPDGATLVKLDTSYLVRVKTDGFEYVSEFTPQYESDENVGSYNSDIILNLLEHPATGGVKVSTAALNKFLSQAELLSNNTEDSITLGVSGSQLTLCDKNVDGKIDVEGTANYSVDFKTTLLKSVLSNYKDEHIMIAPMISVDDNDNEEVSGIIVWSKELTTVLAGVD